MVGGIFITSRRQNIYEFLLDELHEACPKCKIKRFTNTFSLISAVEFREKIILNKE